MEATVETTAFYEPILHTINLGRFGVVLFFLISGFVIPPSIRSLPGFAVNRAFRLLPALWLSVACAAAILVADGESFTATDVGANMIMLARPLGRTELFGVYWTLSVELGFYVLCGGLFALRQLRNWRLVGGLAMLSAIFGIATQHEMAAFPAYLLTGMVLRQVFDGNRAAVPWAISCTMGVLLCALGLSGASPGNSFLGPLPKAAGMIAPLPVFLLVAFRPFNPPRALVWLGTISYSLYLFQDLALWAVPTSGPFSVLVVMTLAIAIAALMHRYVEAPGILLGRALGKSERFPRPAKSLRLPNG